MRPFWMEGPWPRGTAAARGWRMRLPRLLLLESLGAAASERRASLRRSRALHRAAASGESELHRAAARASSGESEPASLDAGDDAEGDEAEALLGRSEEHVLALSSMSTLLLVAPSTGDADAARDDAFAFAPRPRREARPCVRV